MKSIKLRLMPDGEFHDQVLDTVDHTLQTLSATYSLFHDRDAFNRTFETSVNDQDLEHCAFDDVFRLMFIHDLHKLLEKADHAEKGAAFLNRVVIGLVQHHDKFGVMHTGEASFLFLKPIVDWIAEMKAQEQRVALSLLPIITIIDTASLGFLNQARVESYRQIKSVIDDAVKGKQSLEQMTLKDTPDRLRRLIACNNRTFAGNALVEDALRDFPERDTLTHAIARVRFDAGVYVIEPYLRFTIDPSKYRMSSKEVMNLSKSHLPSLFACLQSLVEGNTPNDGTLTTMNLNPLSIKGDRQTEKFEAWANKLNDI